MANNKQARLVIDLLGRRGLPVEYVSAAHRQIGAGGEDVGRPVEDWVRDLDQRNVSALIDRLVFGEDAQSTAAAAAPAAAPAPPAAAVSAL